jgi:dienelactone hydrolase
MAEIDNAFPSESRRRAVDILIERKATFHLQLFSGVAHGFATRGDIDIENPSQYTFSFSGVSDVLTFLII